MKRNDAEQIGKLIQQFLRQESLEAPLNEQRLMAAWKEVLGPTINFYTKELFIKNQILYVHLTSSVLRQELMMGREILVRNLNNHVGATVITNIIFRQTFGLYISDAPTMIASIFTSNESAGTFSTNWKGKQIPIL